MERRSDDKSFDPRRPVGYNGDSLVKAGRYRAIGEITGRRFVKEGGFGVGEREVCQSGSFAGIPLNRQHYKTTLASIVCCAVSRVYSQGLV